MTLELIRIFKLEFQLGSVNGVLCVYLYVCVLGVVCVVVCCLYIVRWDSHIFPHNGW